MDIISTGLEPFNNPEVWGGIECTINRVQDRYRDQLSLSGHYNRPGDIERFASLGIRKLRYPILWERHQQTPDQEINWDWTSQQLDLITQNNMTPIAGLLHHGSGPRFTDLLDEEFPVKFAAYATQVARRFPWLEYYTPINEPLTTARFSGLYGLWYPHHKDELSFFTIFLNQLKGIVLAMQAIRSVNPEAKLIQTEDLAKVHSTPLLAYQANFENERRWLTNDFLCGKVSPQHVFWTYLINLGIPESTLTFFLEHTCKPFIVGYNYYVTSERYLDENVNGYPTCSPGSNGLHTYIDTEAVQKNAQDGLSTLLEEAWDRHHIPIAITECHLSCTREEQMRWLKETWDTCLSLTQQEVSIVAVTAWSLLGAYDWNSLLTIHDKAYESGVFDISHNKVRPTSLTKMIQCLSTTGQFEHPLLLSGGWWNIKSDNTNYMQDSTVKNKPILIIGKTGTLGYAFQKICEQRSIDYIAVGRDELDILDEQSIISLFKQYKPWAVINATGYVRVDDAETDPVSCFAVNVTAPMLMARVCRRHDIRFMTFSSDLIFDGKKASPYHENDHVLPLNVYGESKAEGERAVLSSNPFSLIIRTGAFFGPWDQYNFAFNVVNALKNKETLAVTNDVIISPTYLPDLCHKAMDLFIDEENGIWHLSNDGAISWSDFGELIARRSGYEQNTLVSTPLSDMGLRAKRPRYSVLNSDKGIRLPPLTNAINRFFEARETNTI